MVNGSLLLFLLHLLLLSLSTYRLQRLVHLDLANVDKLGLEGGTTDEETVDIFGLGCDVSDSRKTIEGWQLTKIRGVLGVDTSTVDDSGRVSDLLGDLGLEPLSDIVMDLLGLLDGSDLSGSDGPDGLV